VWLIGKTVKLTRLFTVVAAMWAENVTLATVAQGFNAY